MDGDRTAVTVLLGGDVMLGRGVDQILPHPGRPELREGYVRDARRYVELAERVNGPIPRPVAFDWPWGEARTLLDELAPDVRVLNLETTITGDGEFAPFKGIHYRMHPRNTAALSAIRPDACALANNHVLDFGARGAADTLAALDAAGIRRAGAGADLGEAARPAVVPLADGRRVVVVSVATTSSGVPASWAARDDRAGVLLLEDLSARTADTVAATASASGGDVTVVSVHWGPNWGYGTEASETQFARRLIDAGVDIVHGHSAHHPRPIEFYRGKPILYGCGDVIDDYEGIGGHESYRSHLRLLYLADVEPGGATGLRLIPLRVRRMRLERAAPDEARWLAATVERISRRFRTRVGPAADGLLSASPQR
ncbi:CapA family protein [Nocardia higoensis]|uniref:CapA family protein n=1 Tax=Nocardia higoensis TaxID=228599 RepID=UPI0002FD086C|nr:CapA family protein [Nocardia higoensis]